MASSNLLPSVGTMDGVTIITNLKITGHYDYKPKPDTCYFSLNNNNILETDDRDLPILIVGIAFYNENAIELRRTLVSLSEQVEELQGHAIVQVVLVSDGHRQMHSTTKEYFRHIFCTNPKDSKS